MSAKEVLGYTTVDRAKLLISGMSTELKAKLSGIANVVVKDTTPTAMAVYVVECRQTFGVHGMSMSKVVKATNANEAKLIAMSSPWPFMRKAVSLKELTTKQVDLSTAGEITSN